MVSKPEYNSLQDAHLAHHFRKPVVFRHLLCMGLVTPEGKVLTEREWKNSQRIPSQQDQKTPRLLSLASEGNLRPSIRKSTESTIRNKRRKYSTKEICLPFPFFAKRKGVAGEPYLDSLTPFTNSNLSQIYSIRSAKGTQITKCCQVWERLCPPPNYNISISSWRRTPPTPAYFKLQYIGKIDPIKVLILQQPSGTNSITVFSGTVHPQEEFCFTSSRARDAAFSLVIYENDICTSRVNTCCERRYYPDRKIGGPGGHFLVTDIKGGVPCSRCESGMPVVSMQSYSNGPLRKAVGTKITIDVQLDESDSEKNDRPNHKKERRKKKSMESDISKEEKAGSNSESQNASQLDSRSGSNEGTDDDNKDDYHSSNGSQSDSGSNSESNSQGSENSASNSTSEHSEDGSDSECEEESNKSNDGCAGDEDLSKITDSNNDDYSSDFTSSHSTIKEQAL